MLLLAGSAKAQSITLSLGEAGFFRDSYYKWQRDSTRLTTFLERESQLTSALSFRKLQIESYKRDSVKSLAIQSTLLGLTKVSIDSTAAVGAAKVTKVKKRSSIKTWVIVGLITLLILK